MHDLVMTAAFNYSSKDIIPFLVTLRSVFSGRLVCLIFESQLKEFAEISKRFRIECVAMNQNDLHKPVSLRFYGFKKILEESFHDVNRVLLTDSRDVIFQANPFVRNNEHLLMFSEPRKIKECVMNSRWIQKIFGDEVFGFLADREILCAGTTIGSKSMMHAYLQKMCISLSKITNKKNPIDIGDDQAIHNYLYYSGKLPGASVGVHGYSEVQTLHYENNFTFSKECRLLNRDGSIVPVLHQYDRHKQFFPIFQTMLRDISK